MRLSRAFPLAVSCYCFAGCTTGYTTGYATGYATSYATGYATGYAAGHPAYAVSPLTLNKLHFEPSKSANL